MIIAVVGMCGAGKSTVVEYFVAAGYYPIHFGKITLKKLKEVGRTVNEQNERELRQQLRTQYGMGAYAQLALPEIMENRKAGRQIVIDGLYSWSEFKVLKKQFKEELILLAVYASPRVRYQRLSERKVRSLSEFEATERDAHEIEHLEKGGPIAYADHVIVNEKSLTELKKEVEQLIDLLDKDQ